MDFKDVIEGRRSIRRFKPDPVPKAHIEKMVYAASLAPSGGNFQPWHFLAITSHETRDEMARIIYDEGCRFFKSIQKEMAPRVFLPSLIFSKAPLTFAVLVKPFPLEKDEFFLTFQEKKGLQGRFIDWYGGFVNVQGVAAAIQNMLLAAYELGYGSCWLRIPYYSKDSLEELLGVEKPWGLLALVPVGVADHDPTPPLRKRVKDILTYIE